MPFSAAVNDLATTVPAIVPLLAKANHADVKSTTGPAQLTMRAFIARSLSYRPVWLSWLYAIRQRFARLLGLPTDDSPESIRCNPEEISLTPGEELLFFVTEEAEEEHHWIGSIQDKHLSAWIVVAVEPVDSTTKRFHLMTIVRYNHWTGPIYFNVIRPFHHLIVQLTVRDAVKTVLADGAARS